MDASTCPKCGRPIQSSSDATCLWCGVVFSKLQRSPTAPDAAPPAFVPLPTPAAPTVAARRDPLAPRWWEIPDLFMVFAILQFVGWALYEVAAVIGSFSGTLHPTGIVRGVSWAIILSLVAVSSILKALLRIERLLASR